MAVLRKHRFEQQSDATMSRIETALTRLLGIEHPILTAPTRLDKVAQNFVDHFAVTNADVTGDGVADTTITADGDDSFSIILTGVVITKAALSTEINFV